MATKKSGASKKEIPGKGLIPYKHGNKVVLKDTNPKPKGKKVKL